MLLLNQFCDSCVNGVKELKRPDMNITYDNEDDFRSNCSRAAAN